MSFSYENITLNDPNRLKRRLQSRRLDDALHAWPRTLTTQWTGHYLDFGGGSGALCSRVRQRFPAARITCFEPSISNRAEAAGLHAGQDIELVADATSLAGPYDIITCCEVFEHLPDEQTTIELDRLRRLLTPDGLLIVGVPNEIYAVGLAKGLFRMTRRYGAYDANWRNVLACAVGRPPTDRAVAEFEQLPYIFDHTGFDYRRLRAQLDRHGLQVRQTYGSPFRALPPTVSSEAYFVCTPA